MKVVASQCRPMMRNIRKIAHECNLFRLMRIDIRIVRDEITTSAAAKCAAMLCENKTNGTINDEMLFCMNIRALETL